MYLRGTVAELAGKISINGTVMNQPELSFLTRLGGGTFARAVGKVKTSAGKGKPAVIWEIDQNITLTVAQSEILADDSETAADDNVIGQPATDVPDMVEGANIPEADIDAMAL